SGENKVDLARQNDHILNKKNQRILLYIVLWSVGILLCYFFEFLGALVAFLFFGGNIFLWLLT
ncbi:MAG: hypothetical protein QXS27_03935, partial [Candidatus Jordarchaeaceae archaeon]